MTKAEIHLRKRADGTEQVIITAHNSRILEQLEQAVRYAIKKRFRVEKIIGAFNNQLVITPKPRRARKNHSSR